MKNSYQRRGPHTTVPQVFFHAYDFDQSSLFLKLFEVVVASHVDPTKAFKLLDEDNDGKLTCEDFIRMLRKLGLPLSNSDRDCVQRHSSRLIGLDEFVERFHRFRRARFGAGYPNAENDENLVRAREEFPSAQGVSGGGPFRTDVFGLNGPLSSILEDGRNDFLRTNQYCFTLPPYFVFASIYAARSKFSYPLSNSKLRGTRPPSRGSYVSGEQGRVSGGSSRDPLLCGSYAELVCPAG